MKVFLQPATALMGQLKYPQKFLIVGLLLLLPLIIALLYLLDNYNQDIEFASREQLGIEYVTPLAHFLQEVEKHQALTTGVLNRSQTLTADMLAAQQQAVDAAVAEIDAADARMGAMMKTSEQWASLRAEWEALRDSASTMQTEVATAAHQKIIDDTLMLLITVGNNSNLILDPDLDSYYLMDNLIKNIPLASNHLSQIRNESVDIAVHSVLTVEEKTQLVILKGLAESSFRQVLTSFDYAVSAEPVLESLTGTARIASDNVAAYLDNIDTNIIGKDIRASINSLDFAIVSINTGDVYRISTEAIDSMFGLHDLVAPALNGLLQQRIDVIRSARTNVLAITVGALALTVYLFSGFYQSVLNAIHNLEDAAKRMISGQLDGALVLDNRDELAQVAISFNNVGREMIAARDQALEASRAKSTFLANMSHELRTPLNAILGWARLARNPRLPESERHRGLEVIERNARVQAQLVADLLDVSRIAAGKLEIERVPVDLVFVARQAIEAVTGDLEAKQLILDVALDATAGEVLGDPVRLQQVVSNLLSNAIKFTPARGSIDLRLFRDASTARLTVTDTGEGIEPDLLERIFDPFEQADSSMTRKHKGLGLGLAIVRQLVELQGGAIRAESPGKGLGATFTVELPVVEPYRPEWGA